MSLKEELDQLIASTGGGVIETITIQSTPTIAGLLLVKMGRKHHALPWSDYAGADYFPVAPDGGGTQAEHIEIEFSHKLVTLHGRNLEQLMADIAERRIARVSESAECFLETEHVRRGGPIVTRIEVVPC